jgi:hypothetical protein
MDDQPLETAPRFERTKAVTFDWKINVPTMLYAVVLLAGIIISYNRADTKSQLDQKDMQWQQKVQESDIESLKRASESNAAATKIVADGLQQTNKLLDRLAQLVEWNSQNPRATKTP